MKSSKTMLSIASAHAVALGPRIWEGRRCGVFLTMDELNALYTAQGFNRKGAALRRHVAQWMGASLAAAEGPLSVPYTPVWFDCPPELRTRMMMMSEKCGGRFVAMIHAEDWPVLRRMHGIQETLEAAA